jgi:AraC family transcriptional regulator, regulatory protein of adaptative response / methylphosphotriester-DNA alkyltransferase methyltransferase
MAIEPTSPSLAALLLAKPPAARASAHRPTTLDARRQIYKDALAIIGREYPSDLRLDGVAVRIFTSRRSLQRAFRDAGSSFRTEHLRARLHAAADLMRLNPGRTVSSVSHAVGYSQPAQFAKAFRREFGVSPADFKSRVGRPRPATAPAPRAHAS